MTVTVVVLGPELRSRLVGMFKAAVMFTDTLTIESVTVPVNPSSGVAVTVSVLVLPGVIVSEVSGLKSTVKFPVAEHVADGDPACPILGAKTTRLRMNTVRRIVLAKRDFGTTDSCLVRDDNAVRVVFPSGNLGFCYSTGNLLALTG